MARASAPAAGLAFASVLLAALAAAAAPPLPEGYWQLPAADRGRATVVLAGTYRTGRSPCERLPDGSRRWALLRGFEAGTVYRGRVRSGYVGVQESEALPLVGAPALEQGRTYLLLLRPSESSRRALARRDGGRHPHDALAPDEVVAVLAL
jgi:hypothetical protein